MPSKVRLIASCTSGGKWYSNEMSRVLLWFYVFVGHLTATHVAALNVSSAVSHPASPAAAAHSLSYLIAASGFWPLAESFPNAGQHGYILIILNSVLWGIVAVLLVQAYSYIKAHR